MGSRDYSNTVKVKNGRKRKRKVVNFIYQCICIGIAATVIFLVHNVYQVVQPYVTRQFLEEDYPQSLVELMTRNPETEEFVLNYTNKKDIEYEIDLSEELKEGIIPQFLQWDERWGYQYYGDDFFAINGCGPTCLSMVICGLSGDAKWDPLAVANMAEMEGYYINGVGTSWSLMTDGAEYMGLAVNNIVFDEAHILKELEEGRPIICTMGPGDFTTTGHFIVLSGVDNEGNIIVCDPNSKMNSEKSWNVEELMPQIKNLWSYVY